MKTNTIKKDFWERTLSLTTLFITVSAVVLLKHRLEPAALTFAFAVSSFPLLARFSRLESRRSATMTSAICAVLGVSVLGLDSILDLDRSLADLLFVSAISMPVLYRMLSSSFLMAGSHEYMGENVQGWEHAMYYGNAAVASLQMVLYSMLVLASPDGGGRVLGTVMTIGTAMVLYSFLFVRHISSQEGMSADRLKERMGVAVFRGKTGRASINYKMMYDRIVEYMEKSRPYLNPSFGLEDMAKALYTNSGYVSRVINTCVGVNFSQFVNGYRVRYAMDLFRRDSSLKVTELAQMSGFNTKVTFNMAFKIVADETPGEWCRHCLENMQKEGALSMTKERHR